MNCYVLLLDKMNQNAKNVVLGILLFCQKDSWHLLMSKLHRYRYVMYNQDLQLGIAVLPRCQRSQSQVGVTQVSFNVLLDYSEKFDTIDYCTMSLKLKRFFKLSATSTDMTMSYIKNFSQSVYLIIENCEKVPIVSSMKNLGVV